MPTKSVMPIDITRIKGQSAGIVCGAYGGICFDIV